MKPAPKIATCCYCGTRSVLKLCGTERHELSCGACGAPLSSMKAIPVGVRDEVKPSRKRASPHVKRSKYKPKKRRKSFWRWAAEEIWEEIEDIFD